MIRKLDCHELSEIYHTRMQNDFPDSERKPLEMILAEQNSGIGYFLGYYNEDRLIGYASVLKTETWALLDYFAVDASFRGRGFGTRFLKELGSWFSDTRALLVESEAMDTETAQRRIRFYENAGCLMSSLIVRLYHVDYHILALPLAADFHVSEIPSAIREVYTSIYPDYFHTPLLVFKD